MQLGKLIVSAALIALLTPQGAAAEERPRARDLGIAPGVMEPGPHNAITDVAGVKVGHVTLISGDRVRTGVTAVLPHGGNLFQHKVPGQCLSATRSASLPARRRCRSSGRSKRRLFLPTSPQSGLREGVIAWTRGDQQVRSVNSIVGELNDADHNDILKGGHVKRAAIEAIPAAAGPVEVHWRATATFRKIRSRRRVPITTRWTVGVSWNPFGICRRARLAEPPERRGPGGRAGYRVLHERGHGRTVDHALERLAARAVMRWQRPGRLLAASTFHHFCA